MFFDSWKWIIDWKNGENDQSHSNLKSSNKKINSNEFNSVSQFKKRKKNTIDFKCEKTNI